MDCSDGFFLAIARKKEFHSGDRAHQKTLQSFYLVSNFSLLILKWANGEFLSEENINGNWQKDEIIRYKYLIINNLDSICPKTTRI